MGKVGKALSDRMHRTADEVDAVLPLMSDEGRALVDRGMILEASGERLTRGEERRIKDEFEALGVRMPGPIDRQDR